MNRIYTLIKKKNKIKVKHLRGFSPFLSEGEKLDAQLPIPDALLIEEKPDGVFLYRYTKEGDFCGDTWHRTLTEAKDQAEFEYENTISEWKNIPPDISDAREYVILKALKYII